MSFKFDESAVSYELKCLPEYDDVRGNAMASGDDDFDRQCEDSILADLEAGNDWAWCTVRVRARYAGIDHIVGEDFLGQCSYRDADDFKGGDYYHDMRDCARDDLRAKLEDLADRLGCNG